MVCKHDCNIHYRPSIIVGETCVIFSQAYINYIISVYEIRNLISTVVPHITDAIQEWVERVARVPVDGDEREPDVCIVEVSCWSWKHFINYLFHSVIHDSTDGIYLSIGFIENVDVSSY